MTWLRVVVWRIAGMFGATRSDRDLDEELRSHVDMAIDEYVSRGMTVDEARREALRGFGNLVEAKEGYREQRGIPALETLVRDARFGLRTLAKRPAFTAVAVLTLALGIGANAVIFSVINTLVLSPPPIAGADRVAAIWQTTKEKRSKGYSSYLTLEDVRAAATSFESIAGYRSNEFTLFDGVQAERVAGMRVTANFLSLVDVEVARGRDFLPEEERRGAELVVIVGHEFWRDRLGASEEAVGSKVTLNGQPYTVVGVLPPGFAFPLGPKRIEVVATTAGEGGNLAQRGAQVLKLVGRLREGATFAAAQAELSSVAEALERQHPGYYTGMTTYLVPVDEEIVGVDVRRALWVLLGAVGFLLVIACTNVANLLLVRASARHREFALRAALGAGRWRIVRQMFTESLIVASLGCSAGLLVAMWGLAAIQSFGGDQLPRLDEVRIDGRALAFTIGASALATLLIGILPVLDAARPDLNAVLKAGTTGSVGARSVRAWRDALVVAEVALGLVLLVGAGLMVRSFDSLVSVDPGFDPENVLTGQILMTRAAYEGHDERVRFVDETLGRLGALPDVESVAFAAPMPFSGGNVGGGFRIEGRPEPGPGQEPEASVRSVTPGYFQAMRIPLRAGRLFDERDRRAGVGTVVINEALAAEYFPNEEPIGRIIADIGANQNEGDPERWEIVGVVGDVHHSSLTKGATPELFLPYKQNSWTWGNFLVRTKSDPTALGRGFTAAIREGDRSIAVARLMPLTQAISNTVAETRFYTMLFSLFGATGLLLMLTGIYSVISYTVSQQTQEIGIRMALGAEARDVLRLVLRKGMVLAATGVGIGLVGAYWASRMMETLLFGVSATDPATFAAVAGVILAVALVACYVPARRAARVDPLVALRYE